MSKKGNSSCLCSVDNGWSIIFKYKDRNRHVAHGYFVHELSNDFFMTLPISRSLNIIMEEDEPSSRSPSPLGIKARRRHARISRNDLADLDTTFSSSTRQSMSSSTASSPDSLELAFPDLLKFPCPPTSDLSSSPGTPSSGMPLTPESDCDFALPSPRFNPRRAAIQPLTLSFKRERVDSDEESDSEWYHKEFSKLIATPAFPPQLPPSRPDSILFPSQSDSPTTKRRSITSDTVYPRRRNSKSRPIAIPKYPPPVPPIPLHLRAAPCPPPQRSLVNFSRPPPRSSIPADCVIDLYMDGSDRNNPDSDSSSAFSFTMYEIDFGERKHASESRQPHSLPQNPRSQTTSRHSLDSEFSQEVEVDFDDAPFELDYQLTLPFSIPATPLDFEIDIARSFEKLREEESEPSPLSVQTTPQSSPSAYSQDIYTPTVSPFSFPPSPSPASSSEQTDNFPSSKRDEKVLKSKWSSSTLGSLQEEARNKNRSPSAKWKIFGGAGGSTPSKSKRPSASTKSIFPPTPTSPLVFKSPSSPPTSSHPRKTKTYSPSLSPPSPLRWPPSRAYKSKRTSTRSTSRHQPTNSSDVIVIGYGHGAGLKRRGSNATVSSEGGMSEVSSSSSSSSRLTRKPIPIEMFLRNA